MFALNLAQKVYCAVHPICRLGLDLQLAAAEILYNLQRESMASSSCASELLSQEASRILEMVIALLPCLK